MRLALPQTGQILEWLQGRRMERIAHLAGLLLVVWVAWQAAGLTWMLVPAPELPEAAVPRAPDAPAAPAEATRRALVDTARLAAWHLFGEAVKETQPQPPAPIDAPETHLNLTLKGVLSSDRKEHARAIIADPRGEEKTYGIGAQLPGGAELREIYPDRVILLRNRRHETLRLPREETDTVPAPHRPGAVPRSATPAVTPGQVLRQYRDVLENNPRRLSELVQVVPDKRPDGLGGFRVYPGSKGELFDRLGLRRGDVVTEVNGIRLDDPARGFEALKVLREAKRLSLKVRRGEQEVPIVFHVP